MSKSKGRRPPVAVGHVHLPVKDVPESSAFLQELGLRAIFENEKQTFAVLELRGGTHLIIEKSRKRPKEGTQAPVDFMVDDVKKARAKYAKKGMKPTRIKTGSIHSSFFIPGPDGWSYKITSSHAGNRAV
ncbi:MAG: VOC family protein [Alphaproteobacteria bacterium]|nr:VOC family protein [Alphaproteobacteria bacterium]